MKQNISALKNKGRKLWAQMQKGNWGSLQKNIFRNKRQAHLFGLLCLSTVFDFMLIAYRTYHIDFHFDTIHSARDLYHTRGIHGTFAFLPWNLFLAWIPYAVALILDFGERNCYPSVLRGLVLLISWLLFFPNAPYLITDLLHLQNRFVVPHWYDVMVFVSFAWTGLLLGYASLMEVQRYLESRIKKNWARTLIFFAILLCGFGVYMGRFQRWNSWDILQDPFLILKQQAHVLWHYEQYIGTLGISVVMSGFLLISYWTLQVLQTAEE